MSRSGALSSFALVVVLKIRSPSMGVCAGMHARPIPSWAAMAMRLHCALLSFASVATMPMVVFAWRIIAVILSDFISRPRPERGSGPRPPNSPSISKGAAQKWRPPGVVTAPMGLAIISAPTVAIVEDQRRRACASHQRRAHRAEACTNGTESEISF